MIDLDDFRRFDQITIIEVLDGGIDCLDEVLFGADVVDGDLGDFRYCSLPLIWFLTNSGWIKSVFNYVRAI